MDWMNTHSRRPDLTISTLWNNFLLDFDDAFMAVLTSPYLKLFLRLFFGFCIGYLIYQKLLPWAFTVLKGVYLEKIYANSVDGEQDSSVPKKQGKD